MPSKYEKKRKRDLEADTTGQTAREDEHRRRTDRRRSKSRSRSPSKKSSAKKHKQREESTQDRRDSGVDRNDESLSIEETNKLRAKLGLAPLELEDKSNTQPVEKEDGSGDKVFTEDGVEIVHKPSRNWSDEKRQKDLKEKLDLKKKQRDVYSKVLKKRKGLAEESEDEEEISNTVKWVERNRLLEEQMRKAQEKAKQLDEMDEAFGIGGMLQEEQQKQRESRQPKKEAALTGGLVVGHSVQDFSEGRETVLVLQDKSILDDDDEEEVLINPNMLENERHKLMVERRKKKATHYQAYEEEEVDEFGQVKRPDILAKYNEGMDGEEKKRERFRLNESGQYELDKEVAEAEARHQLMMMNKKFESLESTKYTLAKEFYTEEEVIQFRRPKKGKGTKNVRKKKTLKADDLLELVAEPLEETPEERRAKQAKLAARRAERGESDGSQKQFRETLKTVKNGDEDEGGKMMEIKEEVEEGELLDSSMGDKQRQKANKLPVSPPEQMHPPPASSTATESSGKEKWKKPQASVNVKLLQSLADKIKKGNRDEEEEEDSDDEEDLPHATNVAPMRIEDEAEDELNSMLAKARRLRQAELMTAKDRMPTIKEEAGSSDEEEEDEANGFGSTSAAIIFDATSEKYKSIGGGAYEAGRKGKATTTKEVKMEVDDEEDQLMGGFMEEAQSSAGRKKHRKGKGSDRGHGQKRRRESSASDSDSDFERMEEEREGGSQRPASSQSESGTSSADLPTSTNILGEEKDVTKGVGAMLKLAGEKGYLGNRGRLAGDGSLKHLESKRYSKVDQGRYDIEDKTMRKLERMGTTGTGPTRPFPEKQDYTPKIEINYSDKSGRVLEPKEAFRVLSWKFHGKGPGKKQAEKHTMKVVKREKLKKMNSQDTPLGTLNKQLKKQEQLQAPYLVLSGRGDAAPLQKE